MKAHRLARVSEVIREVAATTILFEIKDPRVKGITVTRAEVAADLQTAKVYVSVMGTEKEQALALHGLRSAAGFVQSKVAARLDIRFTPVLTFVIDEGVKKSIEIAKILADERARRGEPPVESETAADTDEDADAEADDADDQADAADGSAGKR